ncbi:TPA: hypothetical protein ACH3X2_010926 [Trebouxia sp. C0005]
MLFPTLAESAVSPDPIHAQSGCNTARDMTGKVPPDQFASLPDLSIAALDNNPVADDFPAKRHVLSWSADFSQLGSVYEGATVDPVLYSYQGCNCVSGFLPRYSLDSVGLFHMECGSPPGQSFWLWVGPVKAVVISLLALSWLLLLYGAQLQNERNILRINRLKRRMCCNGNCNDAYFGAEPDAKKRPQLLCHGSCAANLAACKKAKLPTVSKRRNREQPSRAPELVTTEGDAFKVAFRNPMDAVRWALHVQPALLQLTWPAELLQHLLAKQEMHIVTKQVEHRGELEEVTESLWHLLPSGGRCLSAWCTRLPWGKELLSLAATAEGYGPISSQVLFRGLSARLGNACGPVLQPRPNLQTGQARSFSTSRHDITECKHGDRTAGGSQ